MLPCPHSLHSGPSAPSTGHPSLIPHPSQTSKPGTVNGSRPVDRGLRKAADWEARDYDRQSHSRFLEKETDAIAKHRIGEKIDIITVPKTEKHG